MPEAVDRAWLLLCSSYRICTKQLNCDRCPGCLPFLTTHKQYSISREMLTTALANSNMHMQPQSSHHKDCKSHCGDPAT
jgi:hypothetical protein